jgi:hypothetical protein
MSIFTLGSDPEFMLVDSKGKYRSAIGVVHGTKENKVSLGNGHYAFYDNVLAEVNIKSANNKKDVIKNFGDCFKRLSKLVGNLKVIPQASHTYDLDECQHPDSQVFGCEPEFCVYIKDENGMICRLEPPISTPGNCFRSGGGHIHIGHEVCLPWNGKTADVVKMLDLFIGIPSILIDHDPTSAARRRLYGGAGTHRVKMEYGLEYRSLSNFWLASPVLVSVIYDLVDFVLDFVESDKYKNIKSDPEKIRSTINSGDRNGALSMLNSYKSKMPSAVYNEVMNLSKPTKYDFYTEWKLS